MVAKLITGLTPEREQGLQERLFINIAKRYEHLFRREIARGMRSIGRNDKDALPIHQRRLHDLLIRLYNDNFKAFGARLIDAIKKSYTPEELKRDNFSTPNFDMQRQIWIRTQSALKVTMIAGTTHDQALVIIRQALEDSTEAGFSEPQAAQLVQARIAQNGGSLSRLRGAMISRTESHSASNASTQMAAKATRLPLKKVWISALTERTRTSHLAANGKERPIDEPFSVGTPETGYDLLMYAGDPNGSAREIINCRCAIGYTL